MKSESYYVFDVTAYGDVPLTEHFRANEFKCKDNTFVIVLDPKLLVLLEEVRKVFNAPVIVNSGYRTVDYNAKCKDASPHSQHVLGKAADIYIKGVDPKKIYDFLDSRYSNTLGLGVYNTFVHVDTRLVKSRWDYRKPVKG